MPASGGERRRSARGTEHRREVERGVFSLRRRLQILVSVLVALIVGAGAIAIVIIDNRDDAIDEILFRLEPAAAAALRIDAALVDQQAAVSGFVLVQREDVLEPYQRALTRQAAALADLEATLAGSELADRVPRLRAAINEWRTEVVEPQLSSTRAGREAEARALATTGQQLFRGAREEVRLLAAAIAERLREEQGSFVAARRAIAQTVAVNVLVAIVLLVAVTILLRRWVTDPLDHLRAQVAAVSGGSLRRPITPSGPLELATVGEGVEAMRVRILGELEAVRRANEGLAQRAPAIVALRDALSPKTYDLPPNFKVAVHFKPAEGVLAGDWYEALTLPGGNVGLCVGDVAGHGATSAIVALRARDLAVAGLRLGSSPDEALALVSESLNDDEDETFVTCFVAVIDPDGRLSYANGGHPPPFLLAGAESDAVPLGPTGPLLGPLPGLWETVEVRLEERSTLVVYTDGVVETTGPDGEEYGTDRFRDVVARAGPGGAQSVIDAFQDDFTAFDPGRPRDDVTVVALTTERARPRG
ncbi:MAG: SpoIIE family protein phosphatase [Actinobacteria bacterium]|nr:SpoIIE family protein phosphatase [Actinomycetota bacterium]